MRLHYHLSLFVSEVQKGCNSSSCTSNSKVFGSNGVCSHSQPNNVIRSTRTCLSVPARPLPVAVQKDSGVVLQRTMMHERYVKQTFACLWFFPGFYVQLAYHQLVSLRSSCNAVSHLSSMLVLRIITMPLSPPVIPEPGSRSTVFGSSKKASRRNSQIQPFITYAEGIVGVEPVQHMNSA